MLTANEFFGYLTEIAFVGLGIMSLFEYLRFRGRARRDIALMFASLAVAIGLGIVNRLLDQPSLLITVIGLMSITAQPYLMLRLVRYYRPLSLLVQRAAGAAMIAAWIAVLLTGASLSTALSLLVIVYFVIVDGYAMLAFIRGALVASGVLRQRLRAVAGGAGLLALALFWAGIGALIPRLTNVTSPLILVTAIGSTVGFYLGLATPHWLRQTWQLRELYRYLRQVTHGSLLTTESEVYDALSSSALEVTGGGKAEILLWHEDSEQWSRYGADEADLVEIDGEVRANWLNRTSAITVASVLSPALRRDFSVAADELTHIIPLARGKHGWGILLVFHQNGSLFADDDLQMIDLLAEQSTILLENFELVEHLRQYAASLEERSAHLTAVNRELEAFSYSVSHDLRAPLRAVDGFSQALLEDYFDRFDDEGKDFLNRIRAESQRMGQLIDDLISLSRFTRAELNVQPIDLSEIVREVAASLAEQEPDRSVEFSIQAGVMACCDARLMRVALENLIGNAWKFTAKKPNARIEFGCNADADRAEYFVRDNGAGFEMAYVDKLFGAFQRLHSMTEFVGTGIGLAIVQRIMHRHGGSIRAEGVVNEGATFYFGLGERDCD